MLQDDVVGVQYKSGELTGRIKGLTKLTLSTSLEIKDHFKGKGGGGIINCLPFP